MFVIFNKGILNIDWDEEMTYVNLSIDRDIDVEKAIFKTTNQSNSSKKESAGKTTDSVEDDDDDDQED